MFFHTGKQPFPAWSGWTCRKPRHYSPAGKRPAEGLRSAPCFKQYGWDDREMTMDADAVRGTINQILFDIDRIPDLSDEAMAARCAQAMINHRTFADPPSRYAAAIDAALHEGHLSPQTLGMARRHTEAELLAFLRRVRRELTDRDPELA